MKKLSIQLGYQNTRDNQEFLAITPYLFLVNAIDTKIVKVIGVGLCWFHYSFYIAVGYNVPKELRGFNNHSSRGGGK